MSGQVALASSISSSRWCMRSTGLSAKPVPASEIAAAKLSIPICIYVIQDNFHFD
jgi:hypothetical protein